ncbi:unnamed protein product [Urochloa humidicola]
MESKAASGDDAAVTTSPVQESAAVAGEEASAVSPAAADASPRPYYECVFCKRGFTTAQALGGHMNIHRRDRAKPTARDSPAGITSVSQNVECYNRYRHLLAPVPSSYPPLPATPSSSSSPIPVGAGTSFSLYYVSPSPSSVSPRGAEGGSPSSVSPRELTLFSEANCKRDQDYLHLGLGRQQGHVVSRAPPEDAGSSERQHQSSSEPPDPESELDLELRLGRRPMH